MGCWRRDDVVSGPALYEVAQQKQKRNILEDDPSWPRGVDVEGHIEVHEEKARWRGSRTSRRDRGTPLIGRRIKRARSEHGDQSAPETE